MARVLALRKKYQNDPYDNRLHTSQPPKPVNIKMSSKTIKKSLIEILTQLALVQIDSPLDCIRFCTSVTQLISHAAGMAVARPYGFEIVFLRNPISGSAA